MLILTAVGMVVSGAGVVGLSVYEGYLFYKLFTGF